MINRPLLTEFSSAELHARIKKQTWQDMLGGGLLSQQHLAMASLLQQSLVKYLLNVLYLENYLLSDTSLFCVSVHFPCMEKELPLLVNEPRKNQEVAQWERTFHLFFRR